MSFWKTLFGGRAASASAPAEPAKSIDYNGFRVSAAPFANDGRYQTAGVIEKEVDGVRREHRFIRADTQGSMDQAVEFSLSKGCQIIDQRGDRVFES
jgi:hypothetical protein